MVKKHQSSRKIRMRRSKKTITSIGSFLRKNLFTSLISIFTACVVIAIALWVYVLFSSPTFSLDSVQVTSDPYAVHYKNSLHGYLEKDFTHMNIVSALWYRMRFLSHYKNKYTWIASIGSHREGNILYIDIDGKVPSLYYNLADAFYAQIIDKKWNSVYPVYWPLILTWDAYSGSSISIPKVQLVVWSSITYSGIDTMFYGLSADALVKQIQLIHESISGYKELKYIPWSQKWILITKDNQTIYFDLWKNIIEQISKYRLIMWSGSTIWSNTKIDLWTMDDLIFIAK